MTPKSADPSEEVEVMVAVGVVSVAAGVMAVVAVEFPASGRGPTIGTIPAWHIFAILGDFELAFPAAQGCIFFLYSPP